MLNKLNMTDRIFVGFAYIFVILVVIVTLYPILYVLSSSISDPYAVISGQVWLFPKGFSLEAYNMVFQDDRLLISYYNTIWYVVVGTFLNVVMTMITAYPLSRKSMKGRNVVMAFFAVTMFFHGGLIPTYLVVKTLGMIDTRWALIFPGAMGLFYVIMVRTFFSTIAEEMHEAAKIDGAGEWTIFTRIILPLSKPILAVMVLFYAVGHWNSYFNALIYLNDHKLYPLQLMLREILINLEVTDAAIDEQVGKIEMITQTVRYATIIVATVPILCLYPFLQKYFVKGVMVGAIKG